MVETQRRSRWRLRVTRDGILFGLGVLVILHELLLRSEVRAEFLLLATTLCGSVPFLQKGDREADKRKPPRDDGGEA